MEKAGLHFRELSGGPPFIQSMIWTKGLQGEAMQGMHVMSCCYCAVCERFEKLLLTVSLKSERDT